MDYIDDSFTPKKLNENDDYYMNLRGFRVMTEKFLKNRGYCCGNGCKHCPYFPKHTKGNITLRELS